MKFLHRKEDKLRYATLTPPEPIAPATISVVCVGDDLTLGANVGLDEHYLSQIQEQRDYFAVTRVADVGYQSYDLLANSEQVTENLQGAKRNMCVVWIGTNDLAFDPSDGIFENIFYSLKSFCAARQAESFGVVVVDMITRNFGTQQELFERERASFNALLHSRWNEFADNLVELSTLPEFSDFTNLAYFAPDGFLLTSAGYQRVAQAVIAGIERIEMRPIRHLTFWGSTNFGQIAAGTQSSTILYIANYGIDTLEVSSLALPQHFSASWTHGNIAGGSVQNVLLTFSPPTPGTYNSTLSVSSNATYGNPNKSIIAKAI